jgi:hypothetical protein
VLLIDRPDGGHATDYGGSMAAACFVIEQVRNNGDNRASELPSSFDTAAPDGQQ